MVCVFGVARREGGREGVREGGREGGREQKEGEKRRRRREGGREGEKEGGGEAWRETGNMGESRRVGERGGEGNKKERERKANACVNTVSLTVCLCMCAVRIGFVETAYEVSETDGGVSVDLRLLEGFLAPELGDIIVGVDTNDITASGESQVMILILVSQRDLIFCSNFTSTTFQDNACVNLFVGDKLQTLPIISIRITKDLYTMFV